MDELTIRTVTLVSAVFSVWWTSSLRECRLTLVNLTPTTLTVDIDNSNTVAMAMLSRRKLTIRLQLLVPLEWPYDDTSLALMLDNRLLNMAPVRRLLMFLPGRMRTASLLSL